MIHSRFASSVRGAMLAAVIALAGCSALAQQVFSGQWLIDRVNGDSVQFQLTYDRNDSGSYHSSWSRPEAIAALQGLNATELASSAGATVHFKLVRDAGAFECEGWARDGKGSGHWTFAPNPAYATELQQRGVSAPSASDQFELAMADVTIALVDELKSAGYHLDLAGLIRAGHHGVSLEYVRGMKQAGYQFGDLDELTRMRDHGVTPQYAQEMASYGYKNLSAEDLRHLRDHGITADYLHSLQQAGFKNLTSDEATRLRDHGVTPEFISGMTQAGYTNLTASELSRLRDHGVSTDYIHELAQVGFAKLDTSELTRLRDHGVTADYVRGLKSEGVGIGDVSEVVRMRDVGVSVAFVREAKAHGFDVSDPNGLIRLRTRGMDGHDSMF
ncbi:MAG: hypothetical protein ACRD3E_13075 [Terriglobales bacterium]